MVAQLLADPRNVREFARLIRPDPELDGRGAEQRLLFRGVSWQHFLALDEALGDDRPGPRFYYLEGDLEIMTTSNEHEWIKTNVGDLMALYFDHLGTEIMPRGQATMRDALKEAGAEPDESWCIGEEKQWPDLVLEIALSSGGVKKLELYRQFGVPEVWFWRRGALEIFILRGNDYEASATSRLLSELDLDLLQRCLAIPSWQEARRTFRAGLQES